MNIHLKTQGQGRSLVFFHGWGFNYQIWQPLIPFLKDHYELVLVDLPGFGLTPLMDWDAFKLNLLKHLPQRFVLTGWSLGGLYATRLAIEAPERVTALVNITSSPRFIQESSWPGIAPEVLVQFHKNLESDSAKTLNEFIKLQAGQQEQMNLTPNMNVEGLKSGLTVLQDWDLREELKSINIPTSFIFGRLDPITPVKTMTIMESHYPNFKYLLFRKAGHMPFLSHKELFIEEFLGLIQ